MEQQRSCTWVRRSPKVTDTRGSYLFKHVFYITEQAKELITYAEMIEVITELRRLAEEHDGIGSVQVFENQDRVVVVVDQLSRHATQQGRANDFQGYATILTPNEY